MKPLQGEEKARYVADMFDTISRRYDLLNTVMTGGMHHRWRHKGASLAVQGEPGEALDVATGTGDFALELARRPQVASVVGLDFAPRMLPLARKKAVNRGLADKVQWMLGDAMALPFPDGRFACVTCGFGLRNFSGVGTALAEMLRVARPGGRVVILDILPSEGNGPLQRLFRLYFSGLVPRLGALISGSKAAYTYLPESVESFLTARQLREAMVEQGMERVRSFRLGLGTVGLHVGEKGTGAPS